MLVLTRRIGEEIRIAGDISVTVAAVKGQRVRLGISAPVRVPVARADLVAESPDEREVSTTSKDSLGT